jgi:chorismate mutase
MYKREKYVYDKLIKNAKKYNLNGQEIWHSWAYIEEIKFSLIELNITIPK